MAAGLTDPAWTQMRPDSYGNAAPGCLHAEEGAGRTCMDDLVVNLQHIAIPTVCLDVISLVASSCGYNRGEIAPRVAHEFTAHVAIQRGLVERPQHCHQPRA